MNIIDYFLDFVSIYWEWSLLGMIKWYGFNAKIKDENRYNSAYIHLNARKHNYDIMFDI